MALRKRARWRLPRGEKEPSNTPARRTASGIWRGQAGPCRGRGSVRGCEIRVVAQEMRDVPRDMQAIGEVVIRGDNVMDGYFKEPEATKAAMSGDWLHTGDMAVWDHEN